jgi:hypothetical protein
VPEFIELGVAETFEELAKVAAGLPAAPRIPPEKLSTAELQILVMLHAKACGCIYHEELARRSDVL